MYAVGILTKVMTNKYDIYDFNKDTLNSIDLGSVQVNRNFGKSWQLSECTVLLLPNASTRHNFTGGDASRTLPK